MKSKRMIQATMVLLASYMLSGCIAAAVGAGAAGGAYIQKHYDVSFKVKKKNQTENKQ